MAPDRRCRLPGRDLLNHRSEGDGHGQADHWSIGSGQMRAAHAHRPGNCSNRLSARVAVQELPLPQRQSGQRRINGLAEKFLEGQDLAVRIVGVLAPRIGADAGKSGQRRLAQAHGIVHVPQAFVDQSGPLGKGATAWGCGRAADRGGGRHASRITTAAGLR